MRMNTVSGVVLSATLCAAVWTTGRPAAAQGQGAPLQGAAAQQPATPDPYQRSYEIYTLQTSAKKGTIQHGEEIYYFKCWWCHNQYAKTGPQLRDLFKRPTLVMGQPVNDQTVREKILNGSPGVMPAYKTALDETDLNDLISYIKSNRCCFDAEEPPPNPRYKGGR
jgi:mono/diheme cytochrome c family protein